MRIGRRITKNLHRAERFAGKRLGRASKSLLGNGKAAIAGAAAALVTMAGAARSAKEKAADFGNRVFHKNNNNSKGVIQMKKSTFIAILVVFAAIAGALGALYFYVLRREKELDEYEQLLFSEDFNDELPDDDLTDLPEDAAQA